jgi:hypothetical protein
VRAETLATAEAVTATLSNGESGSSIPISITAVGPTTTVINPVFEQTGEASLPAITGTGFYPGITVQIGSQGLAMTLVSDTTITGMLGPEPVGRVT